jgi:hypothetical protein
MLERVCKIKFCMPSSVKTYNDRLAFVEERVLTNVCEASVFQMKRNLIANRKALKKLGISNSNLFRERFFGKVGEQVAAR